MRHGVPSSRSKLSMTVGIRSPGIIKGGKETSLFPDIWIFLNDTEQ